jgi:hypothetical protein
MGLIHSPTIVRDDSLILYWDPLNPRTGKDTDIIYDRKNTIISTTQRDFANDSILATTAASAFEYGSSAPSPGKGYTYSSWLRRVGQTSGNFDVMTTLDNGGPRFRQMWFGWYSNTTDRIHCSLPYYNGAAGNDPPTSNDGAATYWSVDPYVQDAGINFNVGQWYNFCVTYDNLTRLVVTYFNGKYARSGTRPGLGDLNNPNGAPLRMYGVDSPRSNGELNLVKIYNRALSPVEVEQNFNALKGRYGY